MKGLFKKAKLLFEISNLDNDKLYDVQIKEYSEKRTKSMNSYYWQLVTQLANVLRTSKEELHEQIIKELMMAIGELLFSSDTSLIMTSCSSIR